MRPMLPYIAHALLHLLHNPCTSLEGQKMQLSTPSEQKRSANMQARRPPTERTVHTERPAWLGTTTNACILWLFRLERADCGAFCVGSSCLDLIYVDCEFNRVSRGLRAQIVDTSLKA